MIPKNPKSIVHAVSDEELGHIRELFIEYEKELEIDLGFQSFDREIQSLPGIYAPPEGCLLLAVRDVVVIGGVGSRIFEDDVCEMKHLYVRPEFRGQGVGRVLSEELVAAAREAGYTAMRLDSLARLEEALRLYKSMGFREIPPYRPNPHPDVVYLELKL